MSLFQSNLRKQIGNLPKILNYVKIIQYYSKLFTGVLKRGTMPLQHPPEGEVQNRCFAVVELPLRLRDHELAHAGFAHLFHNCLAACFFSEDDEASGKHLQNFQLLAIWHFSFFTQFEI